MTAPNNDEKKNAERLNLILAVTGLFAAVLGLAIALGTSEGRSWLCQKFHVLCNRELKLSVYSYDSPPTPSENPLLIPQGLLATEFPPPPPSEKDRIYGTAFLKAPGRKLFWKLEIIYPTPEGAEAEAEIFPTLETPASIIRFEPNMLSYKLNQVSLKIPANASVASASGEISEVDAIANWPPGRYRLFVKVKGENVVDGVAAAEFELK